MLKSFDFAHQLWQSRERLMKGSGFELESSLDERRLIEAAELISSLDIRVAAPDVGVDQNPKVT